MKEMCEKVQPEAGAINYECWTLSDDNLLCVYECYADPEACNAHLPTLGGFAPRFMQLFGITKFTVFCDLPEDTKETVTPIGRFAK